MEKIELINSNNDSETFFLNVSSVPNISEIIRIFDKGIFKAYTVASREMNINKETNEVIWIIYIKEVEDLYD